MKITNKSEKLFLISLIFLSLISYFVGFNLDENSAGGGKADFKFVWQNLQTFHSKGLLESIKLTAIPDDKVFQSTRTPGFYILNKLFNPFIDNKENFKTSIFFISMLVPIIFFFSLKNKFKNSKKIYLLCVSSVIFLSPYFRTSAIWGLEENFGILSIVLSGYIYIRYNNKDFLVNERTMLFLLALMSSACVYLDQKLIIVPLVCYLSIIFSNKNINLKLLVTFYYSLLSLPFLYLIYLWGNIAPSGDASGRDILTNFNFYHLGYVLTIMGFYFLPILFFYKDFNKKIKEIYEKKNIKIYFFFLIFCFYFVFFHQLDNEYYLGGGAIKKLIQLVSPNLLLQKIFLIISFIFALIILIIIRNNKFENNFILGFLIFTSILITPALFQEYYDPLLIILFFLFF